MAGRRWLFLPLLCGTCLSEITQPPGQSGAQGSDATIPCAHDVADGIYDSVYWYRREAGRALTYLGHSYRGEQKSGRFGVYVDRANRSSLLTIRALEPGDRAVYYCALQSAVYLIFGKGTRLAVEPQNQATSPPSVFVVKSRAPKNDKVAAACLAKGFYPKEVTITMNPGTEVVYDSKEGVLSPDGKYSAVQVVKVGPEEAVKCTVIHASQNFSAEDSPSAPAAPTHLPAASPGFCESSTSSSTAEEPDLEKVNMLSLTVLGLRVLMAKSIAFNVLMTAKLFI